MIKTKQDISNYNLKAKASYMLAFKLILLFCLFGSVTTQYFIQHKYKVHNINDFSEKKNKKENVEKEEKSDVDEYYHLTFSNPLNYSYNITAMLDHLKGWQNHCSETITPPPELV